MPTNLRRLSKHLTAQCLRVSNAYRFLMASVLMCMLAGFPHMVNAKAYLVDSPEYFQRVQSQLQPGDKVILKNGVWQNFEADFYAKGTKDAPIWLTVQEKGKVVLSGQSFLRIGGEHLVVSGLVFKNGYTPIKSVLSYRINSKKLANHVRVTELVIDNYSNPDRHETDYWVALYGKHNRLDHSFLAGKRNRGVTLAVRLNSPQSQENYHRIDHNYFGHRPELGSNGGETLRIGTSHYSMSSSFTTVENNIFDRCNGEVEIISVKSGHNRLLNNTFLESRGTLTLRHGNHNLIQGNVFLGNNVPNTGGVRVINESQEVTGNLFSDLTGYRFGSGFTVMNGVPNSPINRYHQVKHANIHHNTFNNVKHIQLAAGSDQERSAVPVQSRFANNLVINTNNDDLPVFTAFDDISGIEFANNLSNRAVPSDIAKGFVVDKLTSVGSVHPNVGAPATTKAMAKAEVGPPWYAKPEAETAFSSGNRIEIKPGDDAIFKAMSRAKAGDILVLQPGEYTESRIVPVTQTITVAAKQSGTVTLFPERSALFEIQNGGSLSLEGVVLSGKKAPDSVGNTLLRTQKWGMLWNYRLRLNRVQISDLNVNHSFHVFAAGARSFAKSIHIQNSQFNNITGNVLQLNKEQDDLGIYNVEHLLVQDSQFSNVKGAALLIRRGGTDESTFGPRVHLNNNQFNNVGFGKRNKAKASVWLHGAQWAFFDNNQFVDSASMQIEHTVGEPVTQFSQNVFEGTPEPVITELYSKRATTKTANRTSRAGQQAGAMH